MTEQNKKIKDYEVAIFNHGEEIIKKLKKEKYEMANDIVNDLENLHRDYLQIQTTSLLKKWEEIRDKLEKRGKK